jgi:O-antigen ligase
VHNAYLEALTDLGVPGLVIFVAVLAAALSTGVRAAWSFERLGDIQMELIARAVVLALVGVLVAEVFVSSQYSKYLWLLIATCPVLLALARRTGAATATS